MPIPRAVVGWICRPGGGATAGAGDGTSGSDGTLGLIVWVTTNYPAYPCSWRLRRRSQVLRAGGAVTARTIASAVSTLSISLFGLFGETLTTCPLTAICPVLPVPELGPVDGAMPPVPGEVEADVPGEGEPDPPGVVALPLTTTQLSGSPTLSQGDGCGAFSSRVSLPLVKVGLLQPASVLRLGPEMAPGILELCRRPPLTRLSGSGEYPSADTSRWPAQRKKSTNVLSDLPFALEKFVG